MSVYSHRISQNITGLALLRKYCFKLIFLIVVPFAISGQESATTPELARLHSRVNGFLNSGNIDSLQLYASQGKRLAMLENNQKELAYHNYILGASLQTKAPEIAMLYLDTALAISKQISYGPGQMLVYDVRGNMLRKSGFYDSALFYSEQSRAILNRLPDSKRKNTALCASYSTAGLIYLSKGDYPKALEYLNQAHALALQEDFTARLHYYKENIAGIYMQLKRYDEAATYLDEVLTYAYGIGNTSLQATSLLTLGQIAAQHSQYLVSLGYYHQALDLSGKNKGIERFDIVFEIARLQSRHDELDSARYYLDLARSLTPWENHKFRGDLLTLSAENYLASGQHSLALKDARKALSLASVDESLQKQSLILKLMSDIFFASGVPLKGHLYYLQYDQIKDSLYSLQNLNKLSELELEFETALKNEQIDNLGKLAASQEAELSRKNGLIALSLLVFLLLIVLVYFIYRQRAIKAKSNELMARQRLANAQMNPHFLFNSLSAIQELVLENKDVIQTSDFLAKFSKLTRQMLNYTDSESIYLSQEIEFLTNYLDLQKLRFGDKFSYEIYGTSDLEVDDFFVPPLITQPFAENALEHGFHKSGGPNKLMIRILKNKNGVSIEIEDNGIGIDSTLKLHNKEHESKAITLTQGRLRFWQRKTGKLARLDILDLSKLDPSTSGTRVTLNLPNI
ncbi:MAG: histidine kinase [Roseivirga sp.]|nr:histidine kinase [Roseivirga sp.]